MKRTKNRPIIALVAPEEHFLIEETGSTKRDAFASLLRIKTASETLLFRHLDAFSWWLEEKDNAWASERLAMIIAQDKSTEGENTIEAIKNLRREFPAIKDVPAALISNSLGRQPENSSDFSNGRIPTFSKLGPELLRVAAENAGKWSLLHDWLGLDYQEERWEMAETLERLYREDHAEDEEEGFSVPVDHNQMLVSSAFRLNLLPGELEGRRYDQCQKTDFALKPCPSLIKEDLEKLRGLNGVQKVQFMNKLFETRETVGGLGPRIKGFAFDPETGESLITGQGMHESAAYFLAMRLEKMDFMMGKQITESPQEKSYRMLSGLVYLKAPSLASPVLILGNVDTKDEKHVQTPRGEREKKALDLLKGRGEFIIMDRHGNLF